MPEENIAVDEAEPELSDNPDESSMPSVEERASGIGHESYEEFIGNGGKPHEYQSAEIFMALKGRIPGKDL